MEWVVLILFALVSALLVLLPFWPSIGMSVVGSDVEELREHHQLLLSELKELDEYMETGRISFDDRQDGRRALAPRLRAISEAMGKVGAVPKQNSVSTTGLSARDRLGSSK